MSDKFPHGSRSLGDLNRDVYNHPAVIADLEDLTGFTDPGEFAAFQAAAPLVRNKPALDIGVGPGRTVPLVRLLTDDYIGVDYAPRMVKLCHERFGGDVRLADARDLSQFEDGRFGFVMFSFNGIDTLDHVDRAKALGEIARVLKPGGVILYSTLNKDGPSYCEVPWQLHRPSAHIRITPRAIARAIYVSPVRIRQFIPSMRNYRGHKKSFEDHEVWGIRASRSHLFRPLIHYITLSGLNAEMITNKLSIVSVFAMSGERVDLSGIRSRTDYFHVVAQR